MIRSKWKYVIFGVVVASTVLATASQASAYWGGWGCCAPVSRCYSSCWTSCCDPCCGTAWTLGWRPGPVRRLLLGRYRWYPTAWGGSCCGYYTTWAPCCGEVSCCDEVGTVVPSTTTVVPQVQKPTLAPERAAPPAANPPKSSSLDEMDLLSPQKAPEIKKATNPSTRDSHNQSNSGLLSVNVPGAAKVYINGRETRATGAHREYVSYGLQDGKIYPYTVRALVAARGGEGVADAEGQRWVWITKTVYLRAGERVGVTFSENLDLESQLAQVEPANIR